MSRAKSQHGTATAPAEATALIRSMLGTGVLTVETGPVAFEQWSSADDGFTLGRIRSRGMGVRLTTGRTQDLVGVRLSEGALQLRGPAGAATLERGDCGLLDLGGPNELRWDEVRAEFYCFSLYSVSALLREAPVVQRLTPRSPALGRFWYLLAQLIAGQVLPTADLAGSEMVRSTILDAFAAVTIEAFDLGVEAPASGERYRDVLVRTEAFLRAHLEEHVTIGDIARAVGLSLRGLQLAYERSGSETPSGHLRRLRLETARTTLLRGLGSTTVTRTAQGIGYTNVGRFTAHYRDAYAESPGTTLRRARARRT